MKRSGVVVLGPQEPFLAEDLEPARGRTRRDLVPHAQEVGDATVRIAERCGREIFDARMAEERRRSARHARRVADEPAHQIDVVDRVLDHRAAAGDVTIGPPRRSVLTLDREVLVVTE